MSITRLIWWDEKNKYAKWWIFFNISEVSDLDVENDVVSIGSQMNSMDDDDNDVEDDVMIKD